MPDLTRQTLAANRRPLVAVLGASALGFATAAVVATLALPRSRTPAAILIPVPAPMIVAVEPAVEPVVVEPPPPTPPPRATTPRIDAACVGRIDVVEGCDWDDGFPAISADGKRIATLYVPDSHRDHPGVTLRFLDTRTSRLVDELVLLGPDEIDPGAGAPSSQVQAQIARRGAAAQRRLDAGRYRSLVLLADGDGFDQDGGNGDDPTVVGRLRTEIVFDAIRVSDVTTAEVVVQARFPVAVPFAPHPDPDFDGCRPSGVREIDVWWDEATRQVYAEVLYTSPPCYCSDELRGYVRRAAP